MKDKVLVSWSGGWDSTNALIHALEEFDQVVAVQMSLECNVGQSALERIAVDQMYYRLNKQFCNRLELRRIKLNLCAPSLCHQNGLIQPSMWALGLSMAVKRHEKFDSLAMGYIQDDVFWHVRPYFESSLQSNLKCMTKGWADIGYFWYPNEWCDKQRVYDYIKDMCPWAVKMIRTCEVPVKRQGKWVQCGRCSKCIEQREQINR